VEQGNGNSERLAKGLGLFSIGLGAAELFAPGAVAEMIGVRDDDTNRAWLRFYGLREIAAGIGILTQPRPAAWLWGRVGGDLLDLATLGSAMTARNTDNHRLGVATAAVLGVTALDVICAQQLQEQENGNHAGQSQAAARQVRKSIRINRTPAEVYNFWRDFQNLPKFMSHLQSVTAIDNNRWRWKTEGPGGITVEWDAEVTSDQPNSEIAWRSVEGADVYNAGRVRFEPAPGGRGTILHVELEYAAPGGALTAVVARLMGKAPDQQINDDLRVFKQVMEVGEPVRSDASIHSGMHSAQPPTQQMGNIAWQQPGPVLP